MCVCVHGALAHMLSPGISSDTAVRPSSVSLEELLELIDKMNRDWRVSGLLVQLPLPGKHATAAATVRRDEHTQSQPTVTSIHAFCILSSQCRAHQRACCVQRHRTWEGRGRLSHCEYWKALSGSEIHGTCHSCSRLGDHQESRWSSVVPSRRTRRGVEHVLSFV